MDMRAILTALHAAPRATALYYATSAKTAQHIIDLGLHDADPILYLDPDDATDQLGPDPDSVVLEFHAKPDDYTVQDDGTVMVHDPATLHFNRVYSGVIDDPVIVQDGMLDEIALGGLQRCTAVTLQALLGHFHQRPITIGEVPQTDQGVLAVLDRHGLAYRPEVMTTPQTVAQFCMRHKRDAWYLVTPGHAMALIDGDLFDAENRGPDGRKLVSAMQITRR